MEILSMKALKGVYSTQRFYKSELVSIGKSIKVKLGLID